MNRNGWSALMYACYMGHDVTSQCLMRAGADLTMTSQQGSSPLILASMCGNDNIIKILLQPEVSIHDIVLPYGIVPPPPSPLTSSSNSTS